MVDGCSKSEQPDMWRKHFKSVFKAEETPYNGNLCDCIDEMIAVENPPPPSFSLSEINESISNIDTDKSYNRHFHWKSLNSPNHAAKQCLRVIFYKWAVSTISNECNNFSDMFISNLNPIPKKGKKDPSKKSSYRPISIGTSENWVLERIFLNRLDPYINVHDCQMGYKKQHSTSHAIEIVRNIERTIDAHVCLLDASAAFDNLSWARVRDQLVKRKVPPSLIKLVLTQICSNRIRVCGTPDIFPRAGVKQGGILSGKLFSICYDDLIYCLYKTGAGILLSIPGKRRILLCIIVYADDILLLAKSPFGLMELIKKTLHFANLYHDIFFNPSKSCILRLGPHNKAAVSVCNIPTEEQHVYLGVMIGRCANQARESASMLYKNTNIMFSQNKCLQKCSTHVKNIAINAYGSIYSLENMTEVPSYVRAAHRYMTRRVHSDWRQFADLPGPNITSRKLYTIYSLDSVEVVHRRSRNKFLLKAELSSNSLIRDFIGNLPKITV